MNERIVPTPTVTDNVHSPAAMLWQTESARRGLVYDEFRSWQTELTDPAPLAIGEPLLDHRTDDGQDWSRISVIDAGLLRVKLDTRRTQIMCSVATARPDDLEPVFDRLLRLAPPVDPTDELPITFWSHDKDYKATTQACRLQCPPWKDIVGNYPSSTRDGLAELMSTSEPSDRGRLVLWHGPPGTGKTWSLQALTSEWKDWCSVEYVLDPEAFLDSSQYMMQVLLEAGTRLRHGADRRPWRLLILEDTGELLSADAKLREGQRLSRSLNVVDGFIGRGLKVLVLVTTNEHIGTLHPAVARPGRCLAVVEFRPFPRDEAAAWLEDRGAEPDGLSSSPTLSELYARLHGEDRKQRTISRPIGFASSGES